MNRPPAADAVEQIRADVASRTPVDAREAESIRALLTALDRLPAPLDQHADRTHVTASAIVVGPRGTVLHRHKLLGLWLQPGGHLEPGERPPEAAVREVIEETGLTVRHRDGRPAPVHVDVHPAARGHVHLDLRYLLVARDEDPRPPPGESQDVRWFSWSEAVAVADLGLAGALRALRPAGGEPRGGPHFNA